MKLYLIRHGETEYTAQKRYCGFSNPPLNATGKASAKSISSILDKIRFSKIYASDLSRAVQSAKIIFPNKEPILSKVYREMNFGIFDGYDYKTLSKDYSDMYQLWIEDPINTSIPEAESFNEFKNRVKYGFGKLLTENNEGNIALITHAGVIRIILYEIMRQFEKNYLDYSLEQMWAIKIDPCSYSIIDLDQTPKIECINRNI
jgi:alpha-ribazole phosphatase